VGRDHAIVRLRACAGIHTKINIFERIFKWPDIVACRAKAIRQAVAARGID